MLLTHRHHDHAGGARRFQELTGAPVRALDPSLVLGSEALADGDVVTAAGVELRVVAHARAHVGLAVVPAHRGHAVLTGDTVLGRGTTVIAHPDGALGPYLESLRRLADLAPDTAVLTGHGPELPDVAAVATAYLAHREERLDQVRDALARLGPRASPRGRRGRVRRRRPRAMACRGALGARSAGVPAGVPPHPTSLRAATPAHPEQPATTRHAADHERGVRPASTTIPAVDCPDDSPSVAAVTTQPNASVAVPAGAVASTPRECAVTWGVMVRPPAASRRPARAAGPGPTAIAPTHSANASSSTGSRRCRGRGQGRSE